jgi:hypothetical protein
VSINEQRDRVCVPYAPSRSGVEVSRWMRVEAVRCCPPGLDPQMLEAARYFVGALVICPRISPPGFFAVWTFA